MFCYNETIETEGKTENYVNGKCANKSCCFFSRLFFFFAGLVFLRTLYLSPATHLSVYSPRAHLELFMEFWAWNQSQRRFQFKYTNKQTNKKPAGAEQSRVEQDKIASKL